MEWEIGHVPELEGHELMSGSMEMECFMVSTFRIDQTNPRLTITPAPQALAAQYTQIAT